MVDWSYGLLTDAEARLFDRLSAFAGPFSLTAAEQVCGGAPLDGRQVAGLLAELVDKWLVAVDRTGGGLRYRLLDTLRAYGAQRLEESGALTRGDLDRARSLAEAALSAPDPPDLAVLWALYGLTTTALKESRSYPSRRCAAAAAGRNAP